MPNHIHLLWKIADGFQRENVQGAFFSFTAHSFKKCLKENNQDDLKNYYVDDADRTYQFWERVPMIKECWTKKFFKQKLNYLHNNPCQSHWNLSVMPEDYKWSSATFYEKNDTSFSWLTHFDN